MIRAVLGHTAMMSWGITLTDIKTVFLHALRPPPPKGTEEVIVVPPKIFVQAGICSPDERWRVRRALCTASRPARRCGLDIGMGP